MNEQEKLDKAEAIRQRIREEQSARRARHQRFFQSILAHLEEAKALKEELDNDWYTPNHFYRFYHQSFKAYKAQDVTRKCVNFFEKIAGEEFKLNKWFLQIVEEGTGQVFDLDHNNEWLKHVRPQVEAMLHAKFFLDLIVKHGEELRNEKEPPSLLENGWAAVLYLFNER